jgi:FKBP-type peptidyl-prolyl cis-trans isomerase 2
LYYINKNRKIYMIEKGNTVNVHYVGKFTDGNVFDTSEGREPLQFELGAGQLIPGFEAAVLGKEIGDKVTANISAEDAYGAYKEDLIVKVPLDKMPGSVEVGQTLEADGDDGQSLQVTVVEINEDHVLIDGNHPLAGKSLIFDIEVISIQK